MSAGRGSKLIFGRVPHGNRGFSLIEVLLALALFTLAITVLTQAFVNTLHSLDLTRQETDLNPVLRFVRSQIIQEPDRAELERGGSINTLAFGDAYWQCRIEETATMDLFRVWLQIEVTDPRTAESHEFEDTLHLLRPTWSDPLDRSRTKAEAQDRLLERREGVYIQ